MEQQETNWKRSQPKLWLRITKGNVPSEGLFSHVGRSTLSFPDQWTLVIRALTYPILPYIFHRFSTSQDYKPGKKLFKTARGKLVTVRTF